MQAFARGVAGEEGRLQTTLLSCFLQHQGAYLHVIILMDTALSARHVHFHLKQDNKEAALFML